MNLTKATVLATALFAIGALSPANAADNANFDVTLSIQASCDVISADTIAFGSQLPSAGTVTAQGKVIVQCTKGAAYNLALNGGANSSNNVNARKMLFNGSGTGTDTVGYQLYQDTGTTVWGDTVGTNTVNGTGAGFGSGFNREHTVYATATILGTEQVGSYKDTVKATVTF